MLEHNAIYAHIGQSPQAESDLKTMKIADINGQLFDSQRPRNKQNDHEYWRDKKKTAPHNSYSSIENLTNIAKKLGYAVEQNFKKVLNLSVDEINLENIPGKNDVVEAEKITAGYHSKNMNEFIYDKTSKTYIKRAKGIQAKEELTGENKGRIDVKNVGALSGYYITNGKAKKIIARKESRYDVTKYYDLEGNELKLNDGNTYVMIMPEKEKITITGSETSANTDKTEEKEVDNKKETSKKPSTTTTTRRR